jgi:hypothetical protein
MILIVIDAKQGTVSRYSSPPLKKTHSGEAAHFPVTFTQENIDRMRYDPPKGLEK